MPTPILMPALSPTMEEGTLAKWHVKVGDNVKSGQVIAEIETDKATMEVEAVDEGRIGEIMVAAGTEGVKVNAPIAVLLGEGEEAGAAKGTKALQMGTISNAPATGPTPVMAIAAPPPREREGESAAATNPAAFGQSGSALARSGEGQSAIAPQAFANGRVFVSPLARRMAAQAGVELTALRGSGPHGRILKRDIEGAVISGAAPKSATATSASAFAQPRAADAPRHEAPLPYPAGSYDEVTLDNIRKTIAKRMTASFRDVPHFPLSIDIELDKLLSLRKELNDMAGEGAIKISVNDIIIRAAALTLKKVPAANASYTERAILRHHHADISVAVATDSGLITPIIFKADTKGLAEIGIEMKDKAQRARERKLKLEEFQGGTFTISNLGMMGIKNFASILNEPQGAILSVGAGEQRAIVRQGALAIATVMSVTLTCDHRALDGAVGAAFLGEFKALIEDPIRMLL